MTPKAPVFRSFETIYLFQYIIFYPFMPVSWLSILNCLLVLALYGATGQYITTSFNFFHPFSLWCVLNIKLRSGSQHFEFICGLFFIFYFKERLFYRSEIYVSFNFILCINTLFPPTLIYILHEMVLSVAEFNKYELQW